MATAAYRSSYSPRMEWFGSSGFSDQELRSARDYAKRLVTYISDASTVYANTMAEYGKSPPKEMIRKWREDYVAEREGRTQTRLLVDDYQENDEIDAICTAIAERLVSGEYLEPGFSLLSSAEPAAVHPGDLRIAEPEPLEPGVMPTRQPPVTTLEVIEHIAAMVGSTSADILGRDKRNVTVRARQFVATVLRARGSSYPAIGRMLDGRDHATMMHSVKTFFDRGIKDPLYARAWQAAPVPCATRMARSPAELDMLIEARR